ncbi:aminotransferase class I/II-fold pyridoxal phosphate-dependent enzyme [Jeotgalibacillus salarius]|uniref:Aminotransferase class I/II-fold pyridoxal phosphate-dependent enzyme n=1 Tax=Jeotgalibacillus salarius TaxID=546023 RepID=A0A4Y8LFV4_9BACL|nr:aminotransferase class I/II-fold pyridoxal phosphate-dependent enzyme [Jeotgalibacillus salarius]TFE01694.1 aminotransferase class I/II-fold pyridoxal phosphate-dependent enzyme [Jeotgalibacillus salarius]
MNMIHLSTPHMSGLEKQYIEHAFSENWIAPLGTNVFEFEKELSAYVESESGIALSSGTAAIHMALRLLDIGPGDIVFCSTLTFVASATPILYQHAVPVFIDSEPETWNMSPQALERAMREAEKQGKLPKAVIVVHLFGQSAKMDELVEVCNRYDVPIIEDAAESLGSAYKGKASGTIGRFGVYSFNGNKIITTSGGGMLVSNRPEDIDRARFLSAQAKEPALHYEHREAGYNYRLSNVLAGIGRGQLKVLDLRVAARRRVFQRYEQELLCYPGISFQRELQHTKSNRWLTSLLLDIDVFPLSAEETVSQLADYQIEARRVWKPMHLQPLFKHADYYTHTVEEDIALKLFTEGICLPSGSNLSERDQTRVIESLKNVLSIRHSYREIL